MKTELNYQFGKTITNVTIERSGDHFKVTVGDNTYEITVDRFESTWLHFEANGQRTQTHVARQNTHCYVAIDGHTWKLARPVSTQSRRKGSIAEAGAGSGYLEATMPGLVLDVLAGNGASVARGQTLVLLEAMKMELRITAPFAGRVKQVHCTAGQVVERGQLLVELETE